MKKWVAAVIIVLGVCIVGCGGNQEPVKKADTDSFKEQEQISEVESKEESEVGEEISGTQASTGSVVLTEEELKGEEIDGKYLITGFSSDAVNIVIPDTLQGFPVAGVADFVFSATNIVSITFPDSVTAIGESQFHGCASLKEVHFGDGLKYIGVMAFVDCDSLESVEFPEGMETLDQVTFYSCSKLKEVYVPATVTEFGEGMPIIDVDTCPNAVIITPTGSPAEERCKEYEVPVRTK